MTHDSGSSGADPTPPPSGSSPEAAPADPAQPGHSSPAYGQPVAHQPPPGQQSPYGQPAPAHYGQPAAHQPPPGQQSPYGQPVPAPYGHQSPYGVPPSGAHPAPYGQPPHPYAQAPYAGGFYGAARDPDQRPGTVTAAGIITIALSGLVLAVMLLMVVVLLAARESFLQGFREGARLTGPGDGGTWFTVALVLLLAFAVWAAVGILLGALVLRRSNGARIALVVSSALTIVVSLVSITGGAPALTLGGAIAVIVLLFTGGAGEWFRREHLYSPPQPPPV